MDPGAVQRLPTDLDEGLWPLVDRTLDVLEVAGVAVAVVRDEDVATHCWGVRDVETRTPVTAETMFHLASVSKTFVATAVVSLAAARGEVAPALDLDAPVTRWLPELVLADGRADEVTARGLLSHTSGLPDVSEYGWHDPQLHDAALSDFARSLAGWRLQSEPGSTFSYSNAGYELLGLLLSRVAGTTFEEAVRRQVLAPLGLQHSTFLRSEVPPGRAASPHVGMPLTVPQVAYPYTRRHSPSSTLHSSVLELGRWVVALCASADADTDDTDDRPWAPLDADLLAQLWRPVVPVGDPPWEESWGLGWALGSYRGHRTVSHSGADPGFGSRLVVVPERRTGVVVLANSNTVPTASLAQAALDVVLADPGTRPADGEGLAALREMLPPVSRPVADALSRSGPEAGAAAFRRLSEEDPPAYDLDDEELANAVWGAIELHRTDLVRPLLELWTTVRPESSEAWTMAGWAHQVDGDLDAARDLLRRALELDPDNQDAALIAGNLPPV